MNRNSFKIGPCIGWSFMKLNVQVLCFESCFCIRLHTQSSQTYYMQSVMTKWGWTIISVNILGLGLELEIPKHGFICDFVESSVKSSKIPRHIASSKIQFLNTKKKSRLE